MTIAMSSGGCEIPSTTGIGRSLTGYILLIPHSYLVYRQWVVVSKLVASRLPHELSRLMARQVTSFFLDSSLVLLISSPLTAPRWGSFLELSAGLQLTFSPPLQH